MLKKKAMAIGLATMMLAGSSLTAFAAAPAGGFGKPAGDMLQGQSGMQQNQAGFGQGQPGMQQNRAGFGQGQSDMQQNQADFGQQGGNTQNNAALAESATAIVTGNTSNSAQLLTADATNATVITMSSDNNEVKISDAGTYIVTGSCADGSITVKKGTTGVILILRDLTLTSATGAPLSLNKGSEVKVVVEGTVKLTDAENPDDENSSDADTADAFDGAAIKVKDGASVAITGSGKLILDASSCKNGIKSGDDAATSLVIDGPDITIAAANDGINAGYDLAILSGSVTITAGDDGLHADRILTIGNDESGPSVNVQKSYEGIEGTVVNLFGGNVSVTSSDDGINAANTDGTFASEMDYSINITGGTTTVNAGGDGLDSNGNINLTGGTVTIRSASNGGEAGLDYDGSLYISDSVTLNNASGIAGPDNMGGMGGRNGMQNNMQNDMQNGQNDMQNGQNDMQNGQNDRQDMQQNGNQRGMVDNAPNGTNRQEPQMQQNVPQNGQLGLNGMQQPGQNQQGQPGMQNGMRFKR